MQPDWHLGATRGIPDDLCNRAQIAAEMLAQNPGLGKFVWNEFQNGSSDSLARIMVAVLTIGIIGFLLDRAMFALQQAFTFSANR